MVYVYFLADQTALGNGFLPSVTESTGIYLLQPTNIKLQSEVVSKLLKATSLEVSKWQIQCWESFREAKKSLEASV